MQYLFYIAFLLYLLYPVQSSEISHTNTQVWGPALTNNANLPVRYLFIHAYDKKNKAIKKDLGDNAFKLTVHDQDAGRVRAWVQVLNLHNGSYIGRFRMYDHGGQLVVNVKHEGKHVASSPYSLKEVYGDECNCPLPMKQWTKALQCPPTYRQIEEDLKPHKVIELSTFAKRIVERFTPHHSVCHYAVVNNQVYRQCHGSITDFKMFMDAPLLSLTRKVKLPDFEFFINLGDWPLEKSHDDPLPIISWCGSDGTHDIILPTYDITNSVLEMLGRVSLDMFSVQANTGPRWGKKIAKGFFRGRDSRQERLDLASMSVKNPDLIDAAITNYFFFKKDETKYGKSVKPISFFDFFKHKYQLNIDGTVAAYRFPYLLVGDALVFKQESEYYEHFYKDLEPWKHYVPLKHDLSDVMEQVKWARKNEKKAREIQRAATEYARTNLKPADIFCYHTALFREFAARQNGTVKILNTMEKVEQPETSCKCKRSKKTKKNERKEEL
uniref:KDEL motif-containing protein 1 n=1 Tax=Ciona intestinalis TaxID=7719 RepID=UPI0000523D6B|nr:KDEL motif-containing protein 1 [Ciona intestinalis]|eukprot:XP_002127452.1 KDEL motif-containing protein 1 [Ciona intestinalis]